jgi:hypothetical protein
MAVSIGTAIYIAVKPLFKIFLNCAMGFILAKKSMLKCLSQGLKLKKKKKTNRRNIDC